MSAADSCEFRVVDRHSPNEERILFEWADDPFDAARYNLHWRAKERHILRFADGQLVAQASVLVHQVSVQEQPVPVGGIGSVVTVPEAQHQGHATATMAYTAAYLRHTLHVPFGLLFCAETMVPFYNRLGWQLLQDNVLIQQPQGEILCPLPVMVLPLATAYWPSGMVRLGSEPW